MVPNMCKFPIKPCFLECFFFRLRAGHGRSSIDTTTPVSEVAVHVPPCSGLWFKPSCTLWCQWLSSGHGIMDINVVDCYDCIYIYNGYSQLLMEYGISLRCPCPHCPCWEVSELSQRRHFQRQIIALNAVIFLQAMCVKEARSAMSEVCCMMELYMMFCQHLGMGQSPWVNNNGMRCNTKN